MRKLFVRLNRFWAELCGWLLSIIAVLLTVDVGARALRVPLREVASVAMFVMVAVVYLGLANCEQKDGHVAVNIFEQKFPRGLRRINTIVRYIVEILIMGIAVYFVVGNAINSLLRGEALSGTMTLPIWPPKFAMAIGLIFFWIQILLNFIRELGAPRN